MLTEARDDVRGILAGAVRDRSLHVAAILFAAVLATNLPLLPADPLPADGAGFTLAAVRVGQPHLPYPIHTLISTVLARLPFPTPALGVNLLSALAGAGAAAGLYLLVRRLVVRMWPGEGPHQLPAHIGGIAAAFHLAFSASYWVSSLTVEVYTLSALLLVIWLGLLVWWDARGRQAALFAAVFVYSLSLGVHYLNLAYLPVFAACVATSRHRAALGPGKSLALALVFGAGLLQFLYVLLRPFGPPPEVSSLGAYWDFNLGAQVKNLVSFGFPHGGGTEFAAVGRVFGEHLWDEFLLGGVAFAALGLWAWFQREKRWLALVAGFFVFGRLAVLAVSDDPTLQDDVRFFLVSSNVLFAVSIGIGVAALIRTAGSVRFRALRGRFPARGMRLAAPGGVMLAVAASVWGLHFTNWDAAQSPEQDAEASRTYSTALLENIPEGSIIVADWAFATPLWYYQATEGLGPAVSVLSLWTEEWGPYVDSASPGAKIFLTEQPPGVLEGLPVSRYLRYGWMSAYRVARESDYLLARVPALSNPVAVRFGDALELAGLDETEWEVATGRAFEMSYVWRSLAPAAGDYQVFVHFVDSDGLVRFQQDHEPVGGAYPTGRWERGDVVKESFLVIAPQDVAPGAYDVIVGVWDPATGARLPAAGSSAGDAVRVGRLTIRTEP